MLVLMKIMIIENYYVSKYAGDPPCANINGNERLSYNLKADCYNKD